MQFAPGKSCDPLQADLSALQLANFIQTHEASTRAHNSLHWLVKNLKLRYDMSLVLKPGKKAAPSRFGTGAKQAPVFPPIAIYELENVLDRMAGHSKWTVLMAAHFMIFGVVRYAHIQRSVLRSVTDVHFVCWCHRGKQASSRQGFFWSAPRLTVTGVDLWPLLRDQLQHVASVNGVAIEKLQGFCFDGEEAKPLAMSGFLQMLRADLMKEGRNAKATSSGDGVTVEMTSSMDWDIKVSIESRSISSCC